MAPGQTFDFCERGVDGLGVERASAFEERFLVAEVAHVRAAARHHDGVRHEIEAAFDEVAPDWRDARQRTHARLIDAPGAASPKIGEERGPGVLARSEKDRIGVPRRFFGQRRDVKAAQSDVRAVRAIVIGDAIRAIRGRDVDLNDDEVRRPVEVEPLHVLVLDLHVVVIAKICGERRQAERREERILDGTPECARRLSERRQDHLDVHRARSPKIATEISRLRGPSSSTTNTRCHCPSRSRPSTTFRQAEGARSSA